MPRETEDAKIQQLNEIRRKLEEAIQRIVDARMQGKRDDAAILELARLQNLEVTLTRPEFAEAA